MVVYSVKEYSGITPIAPGAEISKQGEVEEMIDAQIRNVIKGYAFGTEFPLKLVMMLLKFTVLIIIFFNNSTILICRFKILLSKKIFSTFNFVN